MRIFGVFFLIGLFLFCSGQPLAAQDAAARKKELQRIKREMRETKKELRRADRKERSILTDLDRIDRQVHTGKAELAEQQKQLEAAETSLRELQKRNSGISRELNGLKQAYGRRLRALYIMSRNGYAAALLASSEGEGDPFKRIKYLGIIAERDRLLIRQYGDALASVAYQQAEIAERKQALLQKKLAIEVKKTELQAQKRSKAAILASVREEKGAYEQSIRELEESSAELWAMINKAGQERKAAKQTVLAREAPVPAMEPVKSRMLWPLEGRVLTPFGMQQHPQFKTMVFRRGIEIAAREGAPVRAVSGGKVAFADWYKGYGRLVILEHGPGFHTLYGNLSRLDLKKDDVVAGGQVIGLAGDTGSVKGSKLYFEIRHNGEAQDPLLWLAKR
jgi:septal ring factor EnvC (AmiA/AmiB activator)